MLSDGVSTARKTGARARAIATDLYCVRARTRPLCNGNDDSRMGLLRNAGRSRRPAVRMRVCVCVCVNDLFRSQYAVGSLASSHLDGGWLICMRRRRAERQLMRRRTKKNHTTAAETAHAHQPTTGTRKKRAAATATISVRVCSINHSARAALDRRHRGTKPVCIDCGGVRRTHRMTQQQLCAPIRPRVQTFACARWQQWMEWKTNQRARVHRMIACVLF